ncbi:MAG: ABC-type multidrug transport system, ATPase component [Clostridiaceae bacterium]|jgi:ABC-2 type transport system ATP-binding protein|nr:ABC-type multidrug transport system, ATPase component [Clostridiaceae bacterium]
MLEVTNLTKKYGDFEALKNISFKVNDGTIYGFLGKNGAGKTTTMNILAGLINYDYGSILINGRNLKKEKRILLKKIGYLPQCPIFYNYMNALEYLNFIGTLSDGNTQKIHQRTDEVLEIVGLTQHKKRKIAGYSGGMKQRLGIAVALFNDPQHIFLDEPTSALDPEGRIEVIQLIKKLKSQGKAIFLSTHILNDIEKICDDVSILDEGMILVSDSITGLKDKYIQPIFDVEVDKNLGLIKANLLNENWVHSINLNGNLMSIYVNDVNYAKENLIKKILMNNAVILSYSMRESTLEDIFMKVVTQNGNI